MEVHDNDLKNVLRKDGVDDVIVGDLENLPTTNVNELRRKMGDGSCHPLENTEKKALP